MADEDVVRITQTQRLSEQSMQNFSFDSEFECLFIEIAGYNQSTDSLKRVAVDTQGRIVLSPSLGADSSVWEYGFQNTIADNAITTVLSYTVAGSTLYIDKIIATGSVDAEFQILVNGSIKAKYITSEQDRVAKFEFPIPQQIAVGAILDIKAIHFRTGITADFNASLIGHK